MRFALALLLVAGAALADNRVQDPGAPFPSTVDTPRATAMGGAHAAISTGNDALAVNPAGLAQTRRFHFEFDGVFDSTFPAPGGVPGPGGSLSPPGAGGLFLGGRG